MVVLKRFLILLGLITLESNLGDCAQTHTWIKPMLLFIKMDSCITGIIEPSSYGLIQNCQSFFFPKEDLLTLKKISKKLNNYSDKTKKRTKT